MIAVGDIWTFNLESKLFGQQVYNTHALQLTVVPPNTTETQFVDALFAQGAPFNDPTANILNRYRAATSIDVTYVGWHVARVQPLPTQPYSRLCAGATYGVQTGTAGTANVAGSISRTGSSAGRRYRGRIALAGIPESAHVQGIWQAAQLTLMNNLGSSLIGSQSIAGGFSFTLGYWSPAHTEIRNGVPVQLPPLYVNAVAAAAKTTVRVQRSRTIGVGR